MPIQTPEQAQKIVDLRVKIQANKDAGIPEYTGIDREAIQEVIMILRSNRQHAAETGHTSGPKRKKVQPITDDKLAELFK